MNEQYNGEVGQYRVGFLTEEQTKELEVNSVRRIEPVLRALERSIVEALKSMPRY